MSNNKKTPDDNVERFIPDPVLKEIAWTGLSKTPDYRSKRDREVAAKRQLQELAINLNSQNFSQAAKSIARYLLGEYTSLDQAFGLVSKQRGRGPSIETVEQDSDILALLINGSADEDIALKLGILTLDVTRLRARKTKSFRARYDAAYACLLSRKIAQNGDS